MVDNISTLTGLITSKSFLDVPKSVNYHLTLQRYCFFLTYASPRAFFLLFLIRRVTFVVYAGYYPACRSSFVY